MAGTFVKGISKVLPGTYINFEKDKSDTVIGAAGSVTGSGLSGGTGVKLPNFNLGITAAAVVTEHSLVNYVNDYPLCAVDFPCAAYF